ncbi:MAG: NADH-quinone oxidoreductase subunit H [Candidatus Scalindua sp.]|nr:NADH-quinone oxidoreductase subunit H [Candidatus Scalindua sp.]MCR4344093.1 NADH-quinone oxidoreductase subunit H [Candidatus Scalindua sp.]
MNGLGFLLSIVSSLLFPGIIAVTKAKLSGRKGPGIFQPLFDAARLFRKGSIYSVTTSIIFQIAPVIYFASIVVALLFMPFGQYKGFLSFEVDFVFFSYLLAVGKFVMIIGAMDTGSGFEGMGANREALYSMLVEPAFFILMGSLALLTNHTSFYSLFVHIHFDSVLSYLIALLAIYLFVQIAMVENSRIPIDDPKTHLELTMIHEVMVLDNSGFDMCLIHLATGLKFALYGGLIANFIFPDTWPLYTQIAVFLMVNLLFVIAVGFLEAFRARNKLEKNPKWILTLSSISMVVFLSVLVIVHKYFLE